MKRVLIYSGHSEIVGGDLKYIAELLNYFDPQKVQIEFMTDMNPAFAQRWVEWSQRRDINIEYIPTYPKVGQQLVSERLGLGRLFAYAEKWLTGYYLRVKLSNFLLFRKIFKQKHPDIFWFNNGGYIGKEAGMWAVIAAHFAGVPKIYMTYHNVPGVRAKHRVFDLIYDKLLNKYLTKIIGVSDSLNKLMQRYRDFSNEKFELIYCGIEDCKPLAQMDVDQLRAQLEIKADQVALLIVGNLDEERKGHRFLFSALARLVPRFSNIILLVAGMGSSERVQELKEFCAKFGILQNVRFLGYRTDIQELNSVADIAVVPSVGGEATPYTIKEAGRACRPVIVADSGGCAEGVVDQQTGFLVQPNDVEGLSHAIEKLVLSKELRETMGAKNHDFFLKNFELKAQAEKHYKVLGI